MAGKTKTREVMRTKEQHVKLTDQSTKRQM